MIKFFVISCLCFICFSACDQKEAASEETTEEPDESHTDYHKAAGLMRFVDELNIPATDTTFLIIANDKSCNCGMAGIFQVDSMVRLHGNHPRVWVVNDGAPGFRDSLLPGDLMINGKDYPLKDYGFSGIYPQLFTLANGELVGYDKLVFKR